MSGRSLLRLGILATLAATCAACASPTKGAPDATPPMPDAATASDAAPAAASAAPAAPVRVRYHEAPRGLAATLTVALPAYALATWTGAPTVQRAPTTVRLAVGGMQTLELDGLRVLVPLVAGDDLSLRETPDDDDAWLLRARRPMLAGERLGTSTCGECPPRTSSWPIAGDRCPDGGGHRCVPGAQVRLRGPFTGVAEVDDVDVMMPESLAVDDLGAAQVGAWVTVLVHPDHGQAVVTLGGARAALVLGPGERWEVFATPDGVGAALVPPDRAKARR